MRYRRLGGSDLVVSELGFGCFPMGGNRHGDGYGPVDPAEVSRAVGVAIDRGCNFFDTADVYGRGESERRLADELRRLGRLDDVVIATKGGCDHRGPVPRPDFSASYLQDAVEGSLRRLRRDMIDLYQLHNPSRDVIRSGAVFEALDALRDQGKIRHYGVSIHTVREGLDCLEQGGSVSLQVVYNLYSQLQPSRSGEALLPEARRNGVGVIAREPLGNGFLAGRIDGSTTHEDGDFRAEIPSLDRELRVALTKALNRGRAPSVTPAQLALRFVLDEPACTTTIVGIKTAAQAEENFEAVDLPPFEELYRSGRLEEATP